MSQVNTNAIYDASGGQSAKLYGPSMRYGGTAFVNRIINGDMRIDQRNAGASVTVGAGGVYITDRFQVVASQASKLTAQQNQGSITPPTGFTNYLGMTSSSAYSITTSDYFTLQQAIEGFNAADLAWGTASAATVTMSFWARSSLAGTFGGALYNGAADRSYPFSYTISAANTWEQKTITIPGDTSGTWTKDNGAGIRVNWGLGVGSTVSGTAGAWAGTLYRSATGATSVVGTNGATFYITGVQLEAGSVASPFERRDYGRELMMCQRYYQAGAVLTNNNIGTYGYPSWLFPVQMRAAPTLTSSGNGGPALVSVSATSFYQNNNGTAVGGSTSWTATIEL